MRQIVVRLAPTLPFRGSVQGLLVASWIPAEDARRFHAEGELPPAAIAPMIQNAITGRTTTASLLQGVTLTAPVDAAADLAPIAVFDQGQGFWAFIIDGLGDCLAAVALDASTDSLELDNLRRRSAAQPAMLPDILRLPFLGPDNKPRSLAVRPSGGRGACVHLLGGLGGDEAVRFHDPDFLTAIAASHDPTLVGVSMRTATGSAYLSVDNPGWTHTLATLPALVGDAVAPAPSGHILAGQSSGGFTAVSHALLAPGRFDAVVASAPDALDLESWLLDEAGRIAPLALAWMRMEAAVGGPGQMTSYAASWSPTEAFEDSWPADLSSGAVRPATLDRWLANSPMRLLDRREAQEGLRRLDGRIFIGAARHDEFGLYKATRRFSERLGELGILHRFIVDDQSHFDAGPRLARLIAAALDALPARPQQDGPHA